MIKKRTEGKIPVHYGMVEYYKFFKKDNPDLKISKEQFKNIIDKFNSELINLIIEGVEFQLPYLGATLAIRKMKSVPRIVNGKLYNQSPVDWPATNKLWEEDEEAREKKLLVRFLNNHTSKYVFRVFYKKGTYFFTNKKYYGFKTARGFARLLGKRINDPDKDRYDTFLLF